MALHRAFCFMKPQNLSPQALTRRAKKLVSARFMATMHRAYRFHIGASWAGKPPDPIHHPLTESPPFPADSVIGKWRDDTLSRTRTIMSNDAGEDFFFVQEVSSVWLPPNLISDLHARQTIDAKSVGRYVSLLSFGPYVSHPGH
jgi:hypothetical protein